MKEEWRSVPGYNGKYEVSNFGRVRSNFLINKNAFNKRKEPLILSPAKTKFGYMFVTLCKNSKNKKWFVSRAVLSAFVGPSDLSAAHLDGNKENNSLSNLKWVTRKENESHKELHGTRLRGERQPNSRLKEKDVIEIINMRSLGAKYSDIERAFNIKTSTVWSIINGRSWKHISRSALTADDALEKKGDGG